MEQIGGGVDGGWSEELEGGRGTPESARERLLRAGAAALSDAELLSVLLEGRLRRRSVAAVAAGLHAAGGNLKALALQDPQELCAHLTPGAAGQLLAALELARRLHRTTERRPRLSTPEALFEYLRPSLALERREVFHVLCFNSRNVLLRDARVAQGTVNACPVDPREVFAVAVTTRATAIAFAHNHPSGDPEPSALDLTLTRQLAAGARLLGIRLLDHIVVGDGLFTSMRARGQLPSDEAAEVRTWNDG